MKTRTRMFPRLAFLPGFLYLVLPASASAWAISAALAFQEVEPPWAALGAVMVVAIVISLAFYAYFAYSLQVIAKKTNTVNAWWGWVPILQVILMLNVAKKPVWWILLLFIPLVNIVIGIIVWMAIAEARGKPNWWGILLIVPVVGFIVPGYLAFSD